MPVLRSNLFPTALSNNVTLKLGTRVAAGRRADKRVLLFSELNVLNLIPIRLRGHLRNLALQNSAGEVGEAGARTRPSQGLGRKLQTPQREATVKQIKG